MKRLDPTDRVLDAMHNLAQALVTFESDQDERGLSVALRPLLTARHAFERELLRHARMSGIVPTQPKATEQCESIHGGLRCRRKAGHVGPHKNWQTGRNGNFEHRGAVEWKDTNTSEAKHGTV